MFEPGPGHLGPSVETVVLHTINLKTIDKNFSKKYTIGFGDSKYASNTEQSEFLGFVDSIVSKIKTGVREISTLFKYKNYCCLYYHIPQLDETNMFMVKPIDDDETMEYLIVVPDGVDHITARDISLIKPLFDKVETRTLTLLGSSSKSKMKTPGSSSKSPYTPGSSSKSKMKTPGSSSKSPLFTPGGTATAGYESISFTPVKVQPRRRVTLTYEYKPEIDITEIATDVDQSEITEEDTDPLTFEDLKDDDEEVVKMNCCGTYFLKRNLKHYLNTLTSEKVCYSCKEPFQSGTGSQPSGAMTITNNPTLTCEGHDPGTFEIVFSFPGGTRDGKEYDGRVENVYVPTDETGQKILQIYANLFEKGYMYSIGFSKTKNLDNQVIFDVHQKTSLSGGPTNRGWPDPDHIIRLKQECAYRIAPDLCLLDD